MKRYLFLFLLFAACKASEISHKKDHSYPLLDAQTYLLAGISSDSTYGTSSSSPIKVGTENIAEGEESQQRYLQALLGPNGEEIKPWLIEKCCEFECDKSETGKGFYYFYEISWKHSPEPVFLYLNTFEKSDELLAPAGMSFKKKQEKK